MTSYADKGLPPPPGLEYIAFDHLHFWVGNAVQAASYYITRFGFEPYAYRGLETGSRAVTTHVVRQNEIVFAFSSALEPNNPPEIHRFLSRHGDGVRDVAFRVADTRVAHDVSVASGATSVVSPNGNPEIWTATIASGGVDDVQHSFIERRRQDDSGDVFLPGFRAALAAGDHLINLPVPHLEQIDHVVSNVPDGYLERAVRWYETVLKFHRFWSVDDKQMHTEYSALRSIVVSDYSERVKMPINEPASGMRKSQIQEFVEYYGGSGIQHIALRSSDICRSVSALRNRGVRFIQVPGAYYENLRMRLRQSTVSVREEILQLQKLGILVDFDDTGYLLQIFTKPVQDRPTLFIEIIQRCGNNGFGAGNFKSLFEAIEREQALRGNL